MKDIDYVNSTPKMCQSRIVEHVHARYYTVHPVGACDLTNRPRNLLGLSCKTCKGQKQITESTTSMTMTQKVICHESSCLANCNLQHVTVHCCLVFVRSVKEANVRACS